MRPARRANQRSACQAHHKKIFLFVSTPNHPYISRHPVPQEGRWPSSRTLGRDAVDAAALGAWWFSQGGLWSVSEHSVQTTGANARLSLVAKTGGCVRQKRVVPAPVAGVKLAEARRPNRVQTSLQSVSDGDKTNSSPRSNCAEVDQRSAGLKAGAARHRLRRLTALTPSAPRSFWLCMRSVLDRAQGTLAQASTQRLASHFWRRVIMTLRMLISLRMQAIRATFFSFPLATSRS
jgi:hypothetical protein